MNQEQPFSFIRLSLKNWCVFGLLFILSSCYTKKLNDNQYLLDKNTIEFTGKNTIDVDELSQVIKQKPNKKILGVLKFHLLLHNIPDSAKVAEKKQKKLLRKNKRIHKKNLRRVKHNKDTLSFKTLNDFTTFGEKLLYTIGEPPVIVDSNLVHQTSKQMNILLIKKGYFDNTVRDSIAYIDKRLFKRNRGKVFYKIKLNDPYIIEKVAYESKDTALLHFLSSEIEKSILKEGDVFEVEKLNEERDRITTYLLNNGYYKFNKSYINFVIDSTLGNKKVSVVVDIYEAEDKKNKAQIPHKTYKVGKIDVLYVQDIASETRDTVTLDKVHFYIEGKSDVRLSLLYNSLYLKPGDLFNKQKEQQTFRNFTSLGLFSSVNIRTDIEVDSNNTEQIKLTIVLRENKKQEFRIDGNVTNTANNFGVEGNTFYTHKNIFRGAEVFKIGFNGKLQYQQTDDQNINIPLNFGSFTALSSTFNTIEFGPEMSLTLPKLLFINTARFPKIINQRTKFSTSFNYQRRINRDTLDLDFERGIQDIVYTYTWNIGKKMSHLIEPISFSAIEIQKSARFEERINSTNDKLLAASFQNNIISATRYRFTYNELLDNSKNKKTTIYYSGNLESAGNLLRAFSELTNREINPTNGSYAIFGIQFAQYIKTSHDIRLYYEINSKNSFVTRLNTGLGVPLKNFKDALPFVKSFFSGGTDKNRAWRARSLGPGSFRDSTLSFDKIGEILLESNLEYRFDILGFLDGALFIDAGNIWLMNEDSLRPGSKFDFNNFYKEIAFGAGFGLRIDLDFFLIRFDLGFPLKNPALIEGERWFFQRDRPEYEAYKNSLGDPSKLPSLFSPQFNIGIGFPF